MSSIKTIVLLALGFVLSACVSVPDAPEFQASSERPPSSYQSFDEYVALTREYIDRNRVFISENRANEVAMNAPRVATEEPSKTSKGCALGAWFGRLAFFLS